MNKIIEEQLQQKQTKHIFFSKFLTSWTKPNTNRSRNKIVLASTIVSNIFLLFQNYINIWFDWLIWFFTWFKFSVFTAGNGARVCNAYENKIKFIKIH